MPTGGGKSLCFQVPALTGRGTVVVVSPLLSLMKDQVDALCRKGIKAAALTSQLNDKEYSDIKNEAIYGRISLLYISPEKLIGEIDFLLKRMNVLLFAIDEAHCISQWGHDFRPTYIKISSLKRFFPNIPRSEERRVGKEC